MTKKKGRLFQNARIFSQIIFTFLFFLLLLLAGKSASESFKYTDLFFYIDPFLLLINLIATKTITAIFLLSLIPLALTLILGRFFCGWICPFGAINQFFSWIFHKSRKREVIDKKLLKLKYLILILILVSALMGSHIGGWFDPMALLTRSVTVAVNPAINHTIHTALKKGAEDKGLLAKGLKPVYDFSRDNIMTNKQRGYLQSVFIGLILFGLLFLNLYKRRFFCNYLCPLGALYGIVSRFSLFNLKINKTCKSCNLCSENCTYNGSPFQDYFKEDCMICFNCVSDCPSDSIDVNFGLPKKGDINDFNLGRRKLIGTIASGIFIGTLPKISENARSKIHRFLRPPGSVSEKKFLEKCIRCGECMQVCPTNFIQPALFQTGIDGLWTPVLNAQTGYCEYECFKCTQVCPTSAIEKITLEEKKQFKLGIAVVDRNRCYTFADGYNCAVCEEHCPTLPEKAIKFREVDIWTSEGIQKKVKQIYVVPDICIGCGICENVCPRSDAPGIIITAEEESREFTF